MEDSQRSEQGLFNFDRLPVLTLTAPAQFAVGQPDIPIAGQCVDDGPTCLVTVSTNLAENLFLASGPFNTVVTPPDGPQTLTFRARIRLARPVEVTRQVFVSSKGGLSISGAFQGTILDVDAARALTFDNTVAPSVVELYDRAANTNQIIWTGPVPETILPTVVTKGFLTPNNGALFVVKTSDVIDPLFEWRTGALTQVGNSSPTALIVKGAWASFHGNTVPCCAINGLFLRDLTAGTNIHVATDAPANDTDITPDGHAIFYALSPPHEILEFDPTPAPGTTTPLTSSAPLWSHRPRADGVNVVFLRGASVGSGTIQSIVLRTAGGIEEVLATGIQFPLSRTYYQVAGGWTAFVRPGSGGSLQAWIREPDGTERQLSSTGGTAQIEAISETGDVIFTTATFVASTVEQKRYLAGADGTLHELGTLIGQARFIDGVPFILAGSNLLAVDAESPARSILSEGATGTFFSTDVALLNPAAAAMRSRCATSAMDSLEIQDTRTLPARSRTTIHLNDVPGLTGTAVSTQVDAPAGSKIVAERLMSWDATGYGGHLGGAVDAPPPEMAVRGRRAGLLLPHTSCSPTAAPKTPLYASRSSSNSASPSSTPLTVPGGSRKTFSAGELAALVNRSFATVIDSDLPIVAERAMKLRQLSAVARRTRQRRRPGARLQLVSRGGRDRIALRYVHPDRQPQPVRRDYQRHVQHGCRRHGHEGEVDSAIQPPDDQHRGGSARTGEHRRLDASPCSVGSQGPIVSGARDNAGHDRRRLARGPQQLRRHGTRPEVGPRRRLAGGDRGYQTYVLVSNGNVSAANLKVTFIREDGTAIEKTYEARPGERLNIPTLDVPQLANSNFATIVESING